MGKGCRDDGGVEVVKPRAVEWEATEMAEITEGPEESRVELLIEDGVVPSTDAVSS